ncbi:MAG: TauD/TfdA family dioxygenase [Proteobacteria bacterium]|nr:TauD/TfdA family dioxygenase [Pseudomonadota bacterium]
MVSAEPKIIAPSHATPSLLKGEGAVAPFDLHNPGAYEDWRRQKLKNFPVSPDTLVVPVVNIRAPNAEERQAILDRCRKFNMAIYVSTPDATKEDALALAQHFGLVRFDQPLCTGEDGITEISVAGSGRRETYIPYTDKPLSWHTDGYYNTPSGQVRGFLLHCRRAAEEGGLSELIDPEIVYIRLRDDNPDFITALMGEDVLTIPENVENGVNIRDAQTGPVFSVIGGHLHMRFTDRKRHIVWKDDALVLAARNALKSIFDEPDEPKVRWRLTAGQGLICNNVLHRRTGFSDHPDTDGGRLMYRARFMDRVADSK